ncbi:MAG: sigma-70 family RNA polymerase sigma factor, partial [Actinomycetota bacterium]|nr:sigma-70 family RNA polymerase sigma factor [Actinomycetota bacterium]
MTERSPGRGPHGADSSLSGEAAAHDAAPSDADLIARVREGHRGDTDAMDAFGELFGRHQQAAQRLARQLTRGGDADDLVSEAFAKVLQQLQRGAGPDVAFRAYLLTAVRRLHVDRIRAQHRVHASDDMEAFDPGTPFQDTAVEEFERTTASRAFASLPERWRAVLWHLDVEQQKPAEVAPMLGLSPNSVSALAYRAREGLRQAYLQMHLTDTDEALCRWTTERLGAYVRRGLARRDSRQVQTHLDGCRRCTAVYLELVEVNSNLRGLLAPLLLGGAASGYLASTSGGSAFGALSLVSRVGDVARGVGQSAVGIGAAGSAAVAAVTLTVVLGQVGPSSTTAADDAVRGSSAPTSGPVASSTPDGSSPAARAAGGATSLARPSPGLTRGYL